MREIVSVAATALVAFAVVSLGAQREPLILEHVTVIDGTGAPPVYDQTIVIDGDRIVAVGTAGSVGHTGPGRRIDLRGKYVIPGLIDMHAHMAMGPVETTVVSGTPQVAMHVDPSVGRGFARELLQWGVTTVRNPGGPTEAAVAVRDAVARGDFPGPRIVTAGAVIDRTPFDGLTAVVTTADEVVAEVTRQARSRVDFVKLYAGLSPDLIKAGVAAAHEHGLKAVGHLWLTDWKTAADLGIDGIVHALPLSSNQLPLAARDAYMKGVTGSQVMYQWYEYADLNGPEMAAAYRAMAEHHTAFDPTLVAVESIFFGDEPRLNQNPSLTNVPSPLRDNWRTFTLTTGWTAKDFQRAKLQFVKALELTRRMHRAGVRIIAGTDLGMPWEIPGESLHRELELLVQAGLTPLEAICAATGNAGVALGAERRVGSIAVGAYADLVVLSGNPATDIRQTRSIERVIQHGRELARR